MILKLTNSILGIDTSGHNFKYSDTYTYNPNITRYNKAKERSYICKKCDLIFRVYFFYSGHNKLELEYISTSYYINYGKIIDYKSFDIYKNHKTTYNSFIKSCNQVIMKRACE